MILPFPVKIFFGLSLGLFPGRRVIDSNVFTDAGGLAAEERHGFYGN
jgi:hypothetical protein